MAGDAEHRLLRKPAHPPTIRERLSHPSGLPFGSPVEQPTRDGLPLASNMSVDPAAGVATGMLAQIVGTNGLERPGQGAVDGVAGRGGGAVRAVGTTGQGKGLPARQTIWYGLSMDTLLEAMLDSPELPQQVEKLTRALVDERARREQFYADMTPEKKMEFVNGAVVMHSPVKRRHAEASDRLFRLLSIYVDRHSLGWASHEKILVTMTRNDYEPDVVFFRQEVAQDLAADRMKFPAPDFIAEVLSPSTEANDRRLKRRDYAAHGVGEYWIVDPEARSIEQLVLRHGDYECRGVWTGEEPVTSTAVAGFSIPASAVFDVAANLAAFASLAA